MVLPCKVAKLAPKIETVGFLFNVHCTIANVKGCGTLECLYTPALLCGTLASQTLDAYKVETEALCAIIERLGCE